MDYTSNLHVLATYSKVQYTEQIYNNYIICKCELSYIFSCCNRKHQYNNYNNYNILGNIHAVIVTFGLYIGGRSECVMRVMI